MSTFEIHSRVTLRSLMNRTKYELAHQVQDLMDELDRERARREEELKASRAADLAAVRTLIYPRLPGMEVYRVEQPTSGGHSYVLITHTPPRPSGDRDLPNVGSFG